MVLAATPQRGETLLGLAYGPGVEDFAARHPDLADYVEIPFEQLRHAPDLLGIAQVTPLIVHCASLSMAGFVPPDATTLDAIDASVVATASPWIGEHLAFVSAEPAEPGMSPTHLTYTVMPPLNGEVLAQVAANLDRCAQRFCVPVLLENPPEYFAPPGSTMDQADFLTELVAQTDAGLILDLSHLAITAHNRGEDLTALFDRLPLENVVEVHMSGHAPQGGVMWDDHAVPAPEHLFVLLERLLARVRPSAVTFEYNWDAFPQKVLHDHLSRARTLLAA